MGRAPRPVQLQYPKLVHDLGLSAAGPNPGAAFILGSAPPVTATVVQQELVIHRFAPVDGEHAERAYEQLRRTWGRCQVYLATTKAIAALGLPRDLPDDPRTMPMTPSIAATSNDDDSVQAILWREHDVLVLSTPSGRNGHGWPVLDAMWDTVAAGDCTGLLGSARLYLGLTPATPTRSPAELAASLGQEPDSGTLISGCTIIDLTQPADPWAKRLMVVLAGSAGDDDLSAWAWSRGETADTPFARYLVSAAKLRYEARIRRAAYEGISDAGRRRDGSRVTGHGSPSSSPHSTTCGSPPTSPAGTASR